jgi:hypothetical protein
MTLYLLALASTAAMSGIIWLVQFLLYPALLEVQDTHWRRHHARHCRIMGYIAGPLMIVELVTAHLLVRLCWGTGVVIWALLALAQTYACWGLTFIISVPLHRKLEAHFSRRVVESLIRTNWPRVACWNAKLLVLLIMG